MASNPVNPSPPTPPPVEERRALKPANGIVLCIWNAFFAEWIFASFFGADQPFLSVCRISLVFLTLFTIHRFAVFSLQQYKPGFRDFFTLQVILLLSFLIIGLGNVVALALSKYTESAGILGSISTETLRYAIPYATGGLLVQSILGLHYGIVFSLSLALTLGLYTTHAGVFVPFLVITNLVACLSLARLRSRSAYLRAGLNIAIVAFPFALASLITAGTSGAPDVVVKIVGVVFGGILCAFLASGITPVIEHLGGYVTDIRLVEMATLDHPLLKELSIQAPGTWNHSMVMGMMVEAAADSIGANPVLARVGCYFHDIGKMKKALYFVENQVPGDNRHDKLSPSMSALIIRSHVKDGIELGRKHKLPPALLDMIPQHHGTSLIEYFYEKAKKDAEEAGDTSEVDKALYTYPGPKPQTREAGILMLADGIEAAARTLKDPSLDRIQGLVQKMINKVFSSGQLNECELTLADLHQIAKCFTRVLTAIYHQRVAYHEPAEKISEKKAEANEKNTRRKEKEVGDSDTTPKPEVESADGSSAENSKENLKRLGM